MADPVDQSYRLLAARYMRKQAKQLARQLIGVREAAEIEFVHRARVASRRLRAAMEMFDDCFDATQLKRWRKRIGRITTELGDTRDKDVQIDLLCAALDALNDKACYPGIARLLVSLEQKRECLQSRVVKATDRFQQSGVLDEMQAAAKDIVVKARTENVPLQSNFVFQQTARHILDCLQQTLAYEDSLADPDDVQRHHAMRIATKRLRYTIEVSTPVYDGRLDDGLAVAKKLQTLLGDLHDCDVWLEDLDRFAAKQRRRILKHFGHDRPFARLEKGIEHLRQDRRAHRGQVFHELVDYWQQLRQRAYWRQLTETVEAQGREPGTQQPASETTAAAQHATPATGQPDAPAVCQGPAPQLRPHSRQLGSTRQKVEVCQQPLGQKAVGE
jgi:CHAD domain-containing protein